MAEPIKVGDLVMVVYSCCEARDHAIGTVHNIAELDTHEGVCDACKKPFGPRWALFNNGKAGLRGAPISWLKRIPPLGELDDVKQDEEITA